MVQVRAQQPVNTDGSIDLELWLNQLQTLSPASSRQALAEACEFVRKVDSRPVTAASSWSGHSSCFQIGLEIAEILADLKLDEDSLLAALVYRAVREGKASLAEVEQRFGTAVSKLVEGVLRMAAISASLGPSSPAVPGAESQVETLRKMLVALVDDVRLALIKLAERTVAIRSLKGASEERKARVAREVFDIYAPLAHRLGIGQLKWELEDLAFRYLEPLQYKKIAGLLDERRLDRERFIQDVMSELNRALAAVGIKAHISGRAKHIYSIWRKMQRKGLSFNQIYDVRALRVLVPEVSDCYSALGIVHGRAKHIYSIWRKMQRKGLSFNQIYDVRALRVLVPEVSDCYSALGIVHGLWRHIPREFDDYITSPKENGYRIGPQGKVLEVQVRTHAMHEEAELGVCAHWRYKGTDVKAGASHYEEKMAWLRQVIEWHEELGDIGGLAGQLRLDIEQDRVYVFTPNGHAIDLPQGATPLDFAYRLHTEIGHRCRGAKVGGRIVPLNYSLQTGEQVEIITAKQDQPRRDWLNPNLGYVTTARARAKIVHWFKLQAREQNVAAGKALLERELARLALPKVDYDKLAAKANLKTAEDLFAALGAGDVRINHLLGLAQQLLEPRRSGQLELMPRRSTSPRSSKPDDIHIEGVGNLLTQMAGCCQPLPGDAIAGYITQGRGVSIHRQDCAEFLQLAEREPQRIIAVNWGRAQLKTWPVDILVRAWDRPGLLRDITQILLNEKINVLGLNTQSNKDDGIADMALSLEVPSLDALGRLLARIAQLPNIIEARRQHH